jgi:hypothetical protein
MDDAIAHLRSAIDESMADPTSVLNVIVSPYLAGLLLPLQPLVNNRLFLNRENARRKQLFKSDKDLDDGAYLDTGDRRIDIHQKDLDLTDRENLKFIYRL